MMTLNDVHISVATVRG